MHTHATHCGLSGRRLRRPNEPDYHDSSAAARIPTRHGPDAADAAADDSTARGHDSTARGRTIRHHAMRRTAPDLPPNETPNEPLQKDRHTQTNRQRKGGRESERGRQKEREGERGRSRCVVWWYVLHECISHCKLKKPDAYHQTHQARESRPSRAQHHFFFLFLDPLPFRPGLLLLGACEADMVSPPSWFM